MWGMPRMRYADCNGSQASEETEIVVNIGGVRQVLYGDILNRYPETRLAELANCSSGGYDAIFSLCDDYDTVRKEFYFDRDPGAFKCIIDVYYFGEIHMKRGVCPICFQKELEFWKIDPSFLDDCCKSNLSEKKEELQEIANRVQLILDDLEGDPSDDRWQKCQKFIWKFLEKPESSLPARVVAIMSFLFILISSVVMCVGTIPELQVEDAEAMGIFVFSAVGYTMEQSHPETLFKSIPQSFWWAIITMTTVGYGDIYPKTTLGKCNAAISFLCGVIAIALPIHPIINNFVKYYDKQRVLETATKHELDLMELHSTEGKGRNKGNAAAGLNGMSMSQSDSYIPLLSDAKQHRTSLQSCK
ncbi:UNVERIFIED_CONTAM: hypothetical protein FKN15_052001 [Acipenser sinensis]